MTDDLNLPVGAVAKEKILSVLTDLINRPESWLLKSEVREVLQSFLHKEEKAAAPISKPTQSVPVPDAVTQLDEILRKFKERYHKQ